MEEKINKIWNGQIQDNVEIIQSLSEIFKLLESGQIRSCQKISDQIITHEWIKKAILLKFKNSINIQVKSSFTGEYSWFDKVPLKFNNWSKQDFEDAKIRAVPGVFARVGCYIGENVILMPSFINVGSYIGNKTMIDSGVTIGSCAQIGENCHISSNAVIAGVLEPIQANPVWIGDNCFIGAGSIIAEGVIIEDECVIASGVQISQSTKIIDRETGEISYGKVKSGSVVVSGSYRYSDEISTYAAIVVKRIDKNTKEKTSINDILRF